MSDLEKYITDHREAFDQEAPPVGHAERFQNRLRKEEHRRPAHPLTLWKVAAAVAVIAIAGASLFLPGLNNPADVQYGSISLGEVSKELADVEFYYSSQLSRKYESLTALAASDPEIKSMLEELENLSKVYRELEQQLYSSGTHESVITAMIENFRLRLSLIETLENKNITTQRDTL